VAAAVTVTVQPGEASPAPLRAIALGAGPSSTCAIVARSEDAGANADVLCWGDNSLGQVGVEEAGPFRAPRHVMSLPRQPTMRVGVGYVHACVASWPASGAGEGAVQCWGDPAAFGGSGSAPQALVLPDGVHPVHLTVGPRHTCLTGTDGAVHCAGESTDGQLGGLPLPGEQFTAVHVPAAPFVTAAAGRSHTCALTLFGDAYCWGSNARGQLGDGTTDMRTTPAPAASGHTFVSIWAGLDVSCGVTASHELWCWGENAQGQLGRPPHDVGEGELFYSTTPRRVRPIVAEPGTLVDLEVPEWHDAATGIVFRWGMDVGYGETMRYGDAFAVAASFRQRFCGFDRALLQLRCAGPLPGDGNDFASGLTTVDLEAALGGGRTP
jgi:alpha-tubulin suppressor-like RCC1 family protein